MLQNIEQVAAKAHIEPEYLEPYGRYKAKIDPSLFEKVKNNPDGKLVLVTAITPTKAGEGKTTTSIALADGMAKIGQEAMLCLREPSLGPVFGIKGGATGGGKSTVEPAEDINLHFTGDMHALTSSINLIAAIIDNSIYQGNPLNIDPNRITWTRALDMNDRALRNVTVAQGDPKGTPRDDHFCITVASELMAILCLALDEDDFRKRVNQIIVAYDFDGKPIRLEQLRISKAILKLMREALKVNIVQTAENNPAFIHGGPFANIAHGCNSLMATRLALKLAPLVITEAGFASDLGAEKFLDIASRVGGLHPDACVLVATIRALKLHGGVAFETLDQKNLEALEKGLCNLAAHYGNLKLYGIPVVVAINHFASDDEEEVALLRRYCEKNGYPVAFLDGFCNGGEGSVELARLVKKTLEEVPSNYHPLYPLDAPLKEKIETICTKIYHAGKIEYSELAEKQLADYEALGYRNAFICVAKTPQSLSDDPKVLGAPEGFTIHIREVRLSAGANFVIPLTGSILTMPGLPKVPAAVMMEDR